MLGFWVWHSDVEKRWCEVEGQRIVPVIHMEIPLLYRSVPYFKVIFRKGNKGIIKLWIGRIERIH